MFSAAAGQSSMACQTLQNALSESNISLVPHPLVRLKPLSQSFLIHGQKDGPERSEEGAQSVQAEVASVY